MKLRTFALVMLAVFLAGCVYHKVNAREMLADMGEINSGKNAIINILWYEGSDAEFDYFGYVYAMMGSKNYKVPLGQFALQRIKLTEDSSKWIRIKEINGAWSASRLRLSEGIWEADREGISIQLTDSK